MIVQPLLKQPVSHDWATPPDFYRTLNAEFGFQLDAAASFYNALCTRFFSVDDDGLTQDWHR